MSAPELDRRRQAVLGRVLDHVEQRGLLLVLKAPPGSGKTYVSLRAVALARHLKNRVAVATMTNSQSHDFCRRFAKDFPGFPIVRFASSNLEAEDLGQSVAWRTRSKDLPTGPCIVVATSAKWGSSKIDDDYDFLFIDEAWQLCWADFMILGKVAPRFVLVGDPGQISPVVSIDVSRWQTTRRPPHKPVPEVILQDQTINALDLSLPVTTRLPHDTTELVRPFYDFHFHSWAEAGDRRLILAADSGHEGDAVLELLSQGSVSLMKIPTPDSGPPLEDDRELAARAAGLVKRCLDRQPRYTTEDIQGWASLKPEDIGLAATHRILVSRLQEQLGDLAKVIKVDTAERWQGLERRLMICVHPLSGNVKPSSFDLSTGRLCVMASRHQVGLVIVSRDHVGETLGSLTPRAEQAVGLEDEAGRGHARHVALWRALEEAGRSVQL